MNRDLLNGRGVGSGEEVGQITGRKQPYKNRKPPGRILGYLGNSHMSLRCGEVTRLGRTSAHATLLTFFWGHGGSGKPAETVLAFLNSFIEIEFVNCRVHPFKTYKSGVFSRVTEL